MQSSYAVARVDGTAKRAVVLGRRDTPGSRRNCRTGTDPRKVLVAWWPVFPFLHVHRGVLGKADRERISGKMSRAGASTAAARPRLSVSTFPIGKEWLASSAIELPFVMRKTPAIVMRRGNARGEAA